MALDGEPAKPSAGLARPLLFIRLVPPGSFPEDLQSAESSGPPTRRGLQQANRNRSPAVPSRDLCRRLRVH